LHCEEEVEGRSLLCSFCSSLLEPSSKKENGFLAALEGEGPAKSLLKFEALDEVAKSMAAFMAVALKKEGFSPDVILSSPKSRVLAKHLSKFLLVPVVGKVRGASLVHQKVVVVAAAPLEPRVSLHQAKEVLYLFFCE
jgi:hypothetical protein